MGDIQVHLHGCHDFTLFIFNRRSSHNPIGRGSILANSDFFTAMGSTVFKRFFHRTVGAFGRPSFIGIKAVIIRLGIKPVGEFTVVAHQFIILVLDRNDARNGFKQRLVLIPLLVELGLLLADLSAHLVDGFCKLSDFIELIDGNVTGVITPGNGGCTFDKPPDGAVDEL